MLLKVLLEHLKFINKKTNFSDEMLFKKTINFEKMAFVKDNMRVPKIATQNGNCFHLLC